MGIKDLFVTPFVIMLVLFLAWFVRPMVTNEDTRKYFMPGLLVKIFGALAVGFVYQFYYGGGDTFGYHTHGSVHVWEALVTEPLKGLKMLMAQGGYDFEVYEYSSKIWYYRDPAGYFLIKIAAIFDLFTYATYSGTASLFALLSFAGAWAMYQTFYRLYPAMHKHLALAILFVPSVFFWGSGIFKDTVTLAMLGWAVFAFGKLFIERRKNLFYVLIMLGAFYIIFQLKIYILLCLLPALVLWLFFRSLHRIKNFILRLLVTPAMLALALTIGYFAIQQVGEGHKRYSLENLAMTAKITAYDIRYGWGARDGIGSGYELGELDGTFGSMVRLAPAAINVTLFRPYLFEVRNPLMLFSAVESFATLLLTLFVVYQLYKSKQFSRILFQPEIIFCLTFALVFAFAVGISTYNFGTLSRYKLPVMPVYLTGLLLIYYKSKREMKLEELESTE
ncbi:MAG: hypothetical protein OEX02_12485 [Cyclobacteriaceae bacterium]|nr:hypothetical protein [Cyclobacteriaceae bacterium]